MDINRTPTTKKPPPLARQSQGSHLSGSHKANSNMSADDLTYGSPAQMRIHTMSSPAIASPLSTAPDSPKPRNAPPTWPGPPISRRQSAQTLQSPLDRSGAATPLKSPSLRRTNSSLTMRASASPSPAGSRKGSRSSLGGYDENGTSDKRPTPKRSISNLISGLREAQAKMEPIEEPRILTATDIASEHFSRQLAFHNEDGVETECAVILHDACYGHRFSRQKTAKSHLSMIVERPERINAAVLGAANAYVRIGQHHAGGANSPHPSVTRAAPPPFKIRRTGREIDITSPYVTNVHGTKWMAELREMCNAAASRLAAGERELSRISTTAEQEKQKLHEGDLYLCPESLSAFQGALGGVADAVDAVFSPTTLTKRAFVGIRPPGHHCSADHPSGFCWINNVHVGIEYACQDYGLTHAVILDFDLHHGDGSQAITWARNKKNEEKRWDPKRLLKQRWNPEVGYYSLHDINSYPCEDGDEAKVQAASICIDNAHSQSVWNVHLEPWKTEEEFWHLYEEKYRIILTKAEAFLRSHAQRIRAEGKLQPRGAVFISAGFDASEWEGAGMQRHKVNVPTEFYARFTRDCVALAEDVEAGCDGRVVSVLEGGYSDRALCSGVLSHISGLCGMPASSDLPNVKADDIASAMNSLSLSGLAAGVTSVQAYDRTWWSDENLTALESQVLPPPPPPPGKKQRAGPQPTYATPTESFAYKVRDSDKFARSIAGTMREGPALSRPKTPPAPEVDWVTATQELHKLLVPIDRSTKSHTAEELVPVRTKKERQSAMAELGSSAVKEAVSKPGTRQLRERVAKAPPKAPARRPAAANPYADTATPEDAVRERTVSGNDRRQTIADFTPAKAVSETGPMARRASRRLSGVSTTSNMAFDSDIGSNPQRVNSNSAMPPPPLPRTGPTSSVQAKKVRAAPPTSSSVKPSATMIPSLPSASSTASGPSRNMPAVVEDGEAPESHEKQVPHVPQDGRTGDQSNVDALTSGLKRITLKVGTREESERKVRDKQEAEAKSKEAERKARALKAAETRRRNAEAKKANIANNITVTAPGSKPTFADAKPASRPSNPQTTGSRKSDPITTIPRQNGQHLAKMPEGRTATDTEPTDTASVLPEWARLATNQLANAIPPERITTPSPAVDLPAYTPLEAQPGHTGTNEQSAVNRAATNVARRFSGNGLPTLPSGVPPEPQYTPNGAEQPLHLPSSPATVSSVATLPPQAPPTHTTDDLLPGAANAASTTTSDKVIMAEVYPPVVNPLASHTRRPSSSIPTARHSSARPVSRSKDDLPVFTSTGFIPFAAASTSTGASAAPGAIDGSQQPAEPPHKHAPNDV